MKISPINTTRVTVPKTMFKGQFVESYGQGSLINSNLWHENSSIEKTLDSYHSDIKGKAYFADPMEPISDSIKEKVDYIVYDNEPGYPDVNKEVSENYFGTRRQNFKKDFEAIRQYYYRREMGGYADIADAKYQQWQAAECVRMYDKAGDLRYKKETAEDEMKKLSSEKANLTAGIESTEREIKAQQGLKSALEKHIAGLEKFKKPYKELNSVNEEFSKNEQELYDTAVRKTNFTKDRDEYIKSIEDTAYYNEGREACPSDWVIHGKYDNTTATYDEIAKKKVYAFKISDSIEDAKKQYTKLQKTIENFKTIKENCTNTINKMQDYIAGLQRDMAQINTKIASKQAYINDCKERLIPLFDELKNFYAKQGILKVVK